MEFKLNAPYKPTGDQPEAIRQLIDGIDKGYRDQVRPSPTPTRYSLLPWIARRIRGLSLSVGVYAARPKGTIRGTRRGASRAP